MTTTTIAWDARPEHRAKMISQIETARLANYDQDTLPLTLNE
jgi:hypothetical protein